mmetsp:Transcript_2019/g.5083  ORF Transcript_2019/g.5083 Transcript_2019/m.5083 type:complete len:114 (+) Transcript_2019:1-342(+)
MASTGWGELGLLFQLFAMQGSNRPPMASTGWGDSDALCRKVVLVGNSGTGKTALVLRFVRDVWSDQDYASTIGGSYLAKTIEVSGKPFTFQIWDTVTIFPARHCPSPITPPND